MSRVSVRLFAGAAETFGAPRAEVEGVQSIAGLIEDLAGGHTRVREVLDQCSFFIDGEHHTDVDAPLPDGCRVDVLPPFAGG